MAGSRDPCVLAPCVLRTGEQKNRCRADRLPEVRAVSFCRDLRATGPRDRSSSRAPVLVNISCLGSPPGRAVRQDRAAEPVTGRRWAMTQAAGAGALGTLLPAPSAPQGLAVGKGYEKYKLKRVYRVVCYLNCVAYSRGKLNRRKVSFMRKQSYYR